MYKKTNWQTGDVIDAEKLNNMEQGIEDANALRTRRPGRHTGKHILLPHWRRGTGGRSPRGTYPKATGKPSFARAFAGGAQVPQKSLPHSAACKRLFSGDMQSAFPGRLYDIFSVFLPFAAPQFENRSQF